MDLDYLASIRSDGERLVAALGADPDGAITWCGDWTVKDCVQHVGAAHHVVAQVVEGRPTTSFGVFADLVMPKPEDPELGGWAQQGCAELLQQLGSTEVAEACWSWWPAGRNVGFWHRRMAHETLVHRWDAERGAGVAVEPIDPALAADGVDEYLEVFGTRVRKAQTAPGSGETVHVHCTDTDGEWVVSFPAPGELALRREHAKGDAGFRGPAEGLLVFLWGRLGADEAGVELLGDAAVVARWRELMPAV